MVERASTGESVRRSSADELALVNARYAEVRFRPSSVDDHQLVALDERGAMVGLGRLVQYGSAVELGGIWVAPEHRGRGVARAIVLALLVATDAPLVYCLPFEKLEAFYGSFGFVREPAGASVPPELEAKLRFCSATYPERTLLMRLVPRLR